MAGLINMLQRLSTDQLPREPWVLHSSQPTRIGSVDVPGAPVVRVLDNEAFLNSLMLDVQAGPNGSRVESLHRDLRAVCRVISQL